jgi:hypothetical protein
VKRWRSCQIGSLGFGRPVNRVRVGPAEARWCLATEVASTVLDRVAEGKPVSFSYDSCLDLEVDGPELGIGGERRFYQLVVCDEARHREGLVPWTPVQECRQAGERTL